MYGLGDKLLPAINSFGGDIISLEVEGPDGGGDSGPREAKMSCRVATDSALTALSRVLLVWAIGAGEEGRDQTSSVLMDPEVWEEPVMTIPMEHGLVPMEPKAYGLSCYPSEI